MSPVGKQCRVWCCSLARVTSAMQDSMLFCEQAMRVCCCNSDFTCSDAQLHDIIRHSDGLLTSHKMLVCPYARSLCLADRQNTQAIDSAIHRPDSTSYQLQPSFHTHSTEPEPTARARRAGEEFYYRQDSIDAAVMAGPSISRHQEINFFGPQ